jgi:hypothetical protein
MSKDWDWGARFPRSNIPFTLPTILWRNWAGKNSNDCRWKWKREPEFAELNKMPRTNLNDKSI